MDYSRNGLGLSRSFILSLLWEKQRPVFLSIEIVMYVCKHQPNVLRGNYHSDLGICWDMYLSAVKQTQAEDGRGSTKERNSCGCVKWQLWGRLNDNNSQAEKKLKTKRLLPSTGLSVFT